MRRAVSVALVVGILAPGAANAWCRMTTSTRQPTASEPCVYPDTTEDPPERFLAWTRPCTSVALSVEALSDDLIEPELLGVLERSIATWESVQCSGAPLGVDIAIRDEQSTCLEPLYRDDGGNVNAIMFVQDWRDRMYDPAAFAVTTVWHRRSTGEILDADMEVNEQRGPYGICPPEGCLDDRTVDLENVVTHELGHYLGLAHSTDPDATMFASAIAGETIKRDLADDDVAGICEVYPPGQPAGECDYTPRGGLTLHCEEGCSVAAVGSRGGSGAGAWMVAFAALWWSRRRWRSPLRRNSDRFRTPRRDSFY